MYFCLLGRVLPCTQKTLDNLNQKGRLNGNSVSTYFTLVVFCAVSSLASTDLCRDGDARRFQRETGVRASEH